MIHDQTKKFEWDATEFEHKPKSTDWFWALGIAVVTGIILCIIGHNYLLAILLAAGGILIGWHANDVPDPIHVEISERGIMLGKDLYTYDTIKSFWMYTDHSDHNKIIIVTSRTVMPQRILTLSETIKPTEIREYLLDCVDEKESKPTSLELLAESIGL